MPLRVSVVTPEKEIFSDDADEVVVLTINGELTILPEHVSLVAQISPGELVLKRGSKSERLVVVGGFLEVNKDVVTILADYAVHGKDISEAAAQQAKDRAEKAMKERKSDVDFATAEAEFRRAILELKVARRHKATV